MINQYSRSSSTKFALAVVSGLCMSLFFSAMASAQVFRWDIITFNAKGQPAPGGHAVATADNVGGSIASIVLTGSGTFDISNVSAVTGGGTFVVRNFPNGAIRNSGTYQVMSLVHFEPNPVVPGTTILGGLAVLAVKYSDGSEGILVVNCAVNAPPQETEGVTATKGAVDFWSIQGGFTLLHTGTTF